MVNKEEQNMKINIHSTAQSPAGHQLQTNNDTQNPPVTIANITTTAYLVL